MVTNVTLRFDRDVELPVRPRSREANRFILDHLEELRGQLMKAPGRQKLSIREDRIVK